DDFSLCFPQHGIRKICVYRITENGENRRSISMNHAVRAQFVPPALRGMSHVLSPLRVVVRAGVFICEFVESHFFFVFSPSGMLFNRGTCFTLFVQKTKMDIGCRSGSHRLRVAIARLTREGRSCSTNNCSISLMAFPKDAGAFT